MMAKFDWDCDGGSEKWLRSAYIQKIGLTRLVDGW